MTLKVRPGENLKAKRTGEDFGPWSASTVIRASRPASVENVRGGAGWRMGHATLESQESSIAPHKRSRQKFEEGTHRSNKNRARSTQLTSHFFI